MKQSKKRNKNKEELDPFSGAKKKKKPPELRAKVEFQFTDTEGKKHSLPNGRLKVNPDGYITFLVKTEEGWQNVKGKLDYLKIRYERKLLAIPRKVSREST